MPKLFIKGVAPDNVVILSEIERAESTESLDGNAPHRTSQNPSGACQGNNNGSGETNLVFDDTASIESLHSEISGETIGIDASENVCEDDHGMKVRPSLSVRGDASLTVVNADVGEKLATSGKTSNYSMGKMLSRNGSKVYMGENSTSVSETMDGGRVGGKDNEPADDEEPMRCGWFSWRPDCIQVSWRRRKIS